MAISKLKRPGIQASPRAAAADGAPENSEQPLQTVVTGAHVPIPVPAEGSKGIARFQSSPDTRTALLKYLRHLATRFGHVPNKQEILKALGHGGDEMLVAHFGTFTQFVAAAFARFRAIGYNELKDLLKTFCEGKQLPVTLQMIDDDLSMPPALIFVELLDEFPQLLVRGESADFPKPPVDRAPLSARPMSVDRPRISPVPLVFVNPPLWIPETYEEVVDFFSEFGVLAPERMLQGIRQREGHSLSDPFPEYVTIHFAWRRDGGLSALEVKPGVHVDHKEYNDSFVVFRRPHGMLHYYPVVIPDGDGERVIASWLASQGIPADHTVEKSYINYALGFKPNGGKAHASPYHLPVLDDYFEQFQGIDRLMAIASVLDPRFKKNPQAVRLSFMTNPTRGEYHAIQVEPWDMKKPWEVDRLAAQYLFVRIGGEWKLRRYGGMLAERYASHLMTDLPDRLRVIANNKHVPISWPQLVEVMAAPSLRAILFKTLWERDNRGKPFPKNFVFQSSKRGQDVRQAESMAVLDAQMLGGRQPLRHLAWLWFEGDALQRSRGRNAGDLVESYLSSLGLKFQYPLELAVVLRLFNDETPIVGEEPLTPAKVLVHFDRFGKDAVHRLVSNMMLAHRREGDLPQRVTLSGQVQHYNGVAISGLRFREGGHLESGKPNSSLFAVEWVLQPDGSYQITQRAGGLGRRIEETIANSRGVDAKTAVVDMVATGEGEYAPAISSSGGAVFAPDADQIEKQARQLASYGSENYGNLDEQACKPEPMTTPAEVMPVPRLERPAEAVDLPKLGGYVTMDPEDLKLLQIPPSDKIPVITPASAAAVIVVAAILALADGPLPFGDAAAASLMGARLVF